MDSWLTSVQHRIYMDHATAQLGLQTGLRGGETRQRLTAPKHTRGTRKHARLSYIYIA